MSAMTSGDLYYDPYDYEIDDAAQTVWKRMRDEAPVYWNDKFSFYALSRYDDVLQAVLDTETFSSAHATVIELMTPEPTQMPMMIWMDPPDHTWHRKLVSRAFTVKAMTALEERVSRLCDTLLSQYAGSGGFDFLDDYGAIIPPTMILALLGFPEGFEREWRKGIDSMFHSSGEGGFDQNRDDLIGTGGAIGSGVYQALPELMAKRRSEPQDDLISTLVHTPLEQADGTTRPLNEVEIMSFVTLIGIAGTETVARLLGWAAYLLDRHRDERQKLLDRPDLIANGIEECLRYEAPSPVNGRWLTRDVEMHGQTLPKDSKIVLLNGSGNRDERHYSDPDRFDVGRKIDRHLSFGYGAHFCIGAALARMEGRVAVREMLERFPNFQVDHDRTVMVRTSTVRGFEKVPVVV